MGAYWELMKAGFRRYSRYRAALLSSLFTNTLFGLVRASVLLTALAAAGHHVGGYSPRQAATYVWLGQGLLGALDVWGGSVEMGARIKSGDIAVDLARPLPLLGASLATNYGRAAFELLPRLVPIMCMGALLTGLALPTSPWFYALGLVSVILAVALCHLYYTTVHMIGLWTSETRGFVTIAMIVQQILSGFVVPITWFPAWLLPIALVSPFPAMVQTPIDVLSARIPLPSAATAVGMQAIWALALFGFAQAVLNAGRRKVVIQGG